MAGAHVIEVPLPAEARLSPFDLDLLKTALQTLVSLHFRCSDESQRAIQALEQEGWHVHLGPTWLAVGRREHGSEQALGRTPDEAIARLYEYAHNQTDGGCP